RRTKIASTCEIGPQPGVNSCLLQEPALPQPCAERMSNRTQNVSAPRPALSVSREALLQKWLRNRPTTSAGADDVIPRRTERGPAPLSFEQQRIWFFHQLEPHSPLYHMPIAAELRGALEPRALQQALDAVVARHEAFRTRFVGDDAMQVVDAPSAVP